MNTPSLCLLHGWAANGFVFNRLRQALPNTWHISTPHLAGHGDAPALLDFSVVEAAHQIAHSLTRPSHLFGWSLGGLIALYVAHSYPEKVKSLILCSTFAKFQSDDDYPEGLNHSALDKMVGFFQQDYPKHMQQFLQLQLLHTPHSQNIISAILPDMLKHGTPQALADALAAVKCADARPFLQHIQQPCLLIYGNKDTITPLRMGDYLMRHLVQAQMWTVDKAAHAPFLSHEQVVADKIHHFIEEIEYK